jgi:hypothetical protein
MSRNELDEGFPLDQKLLADILTPEVFADIIDNGGFLLGEPLLRAWRRMEMQGDPPDRLRIEVYKPDLDRLVDKMRREQKLVRRAQRAKGGRA